MPPLCLAVVPADDLLRSQAAEEEAFLCDGGDELRIGGLLAEVLLLHLRLVDRESLLVVDDLRRAAEHHAARSCAPPLSQAEVLVDEQGAVRARLEILEVPPCCAEREIEVAGLVPVPDGCDLRVAVVAHGA